MTHKINHANIKEWAANYDGELFDGILCDPPYHLVSIAKRFGGESARNTPAMNTKEGGVFARKAAGFMGKEWDGVDENGVGIAQDPEMWALLFKLLKPGGHLLAFSGSRTYHRMAVAIEDAGFEIRDQLIWMYGSGFPKSLNIGKAVDKIQGNEREITGDNPNFRPVSGKEGYLGQSNFRQTDGMSVQTKGTSEWEGYGTALKPAIEPIILARKPISEKNIALNVLKHGTGGLNIDGTRITSQDNLGRKNNVSPYSNDRTWSVSKTPPQDNTDNPPIGRFPANLIHDGSDEVEAVFPQTGGGKYSKQSRKRKGFMLSGSEDNVQEANAPDQYGDSGSASRYFYCAKSSKRERNAGLDNMPDMPMAMSNQAKAELKRGNTDFAGHKEGDWNGVKMLKNHHPTVKPLSLTKYLATLIKPPTGGRLLVPFSGSGSEMIGALQAGWEYVEGVELTEEYIPIAEARIKHWIKEPVQQELV